MIVTKSMIFATVAGVDGPCWHSPVASTLYHAPPPLLPHAETTEEAVQDLPQTLDSSGIKLHLRVL